MRVYHCRSVSKGLVGLGLLVAALAGGCAEPAAESGEFELQLEPRAPFAVVGQFRLSPLPGSTEVHDLDFDANTSRLHTRLPAGQYILTLRPGARLVCPEDDDLEAVFITGTPIADSTRLVSSWPQRISIAAGGLTTAHIGVGLPPAAVARPHAVNSALADSANPCRSATEDSVRPMLSRR